MMCAKYRPERWSDDRLHMVQSWHMNISCRWIPVDKTRPRLNVAHAAHGLTPRIYGIVHWLDSVGTAECCDLRHIKGKGVSFWKARAPAWCSIDEKLCEGRRSGRRSRAQEAALWSIA